MISDFNDKWLLLTSTVVALLGINNLMRVNNVTQWTPIDLRRSSTLSVLCMTLKCPFAEPELMMPKSSWKKCTCQCYPLCIRDTHQHNFFISDCLLSVRNKFTGNLNDLLQVGKAMDASSMFDVPIEMLAFLEGDISNPELYQYKLYEDTETRATKFAERVLYLQVNTISAASVSASVNYTPLCVWSHVLDVSTQHVEYLTFVCMQNVTNICKEGASTNPRSDVKGNNTKT